MKKDKKTIANITMNLAQKLKQIDASWLDHSYAYTVAYKGGVDSPYTLLLHSTVYMIEEVEKYYRNIFQNKLFGEEKKGSLEIRYWTINLWTSPKQNNKRIINKITSVY